MEFLPAFLMDRKKMEAELVPYSSFMGFCK